MSGFSLLGMNLPGMSLPGMSLPGKSLPGMDSAGTETENRGSQEKRKPICRGRQRPLGGVSLAPEEVAFPVLLGLFLDDANFSYIRNKAFFN
jgi:hypothetical protein